MQALKDQRVIALIKDRSKTDEAGVREQMQQMIRRVPATERLKRSAHMTDYRSRPSRSSSRSKLLSPTLEDIIDVGDIQERKKGRKEGAPGQMCVLHSLSLWAAAGEMRDRRQRSVGLFRGHFFLRLELIFPGKTRGRASFSLLTPGQEMGSLAARGLVDGAFTCLVVGAPQPPPDGHRSIIGWLRLIASLPNGINEQGFFSSRCF